jgi:uncharacterized OB-fold protein
VKLACLLRAGEYKVGDPRPEGYGAFQEWARVQYNSGLRQQRCPTCGKVWFPQEKHCEEVGT